MSFENEPMQIAAARQNESECLHALRDLRILETPAEDAFSSLAQAASLLCSTPIAMVSLIDADRQWFKANVGLGDLLETSRDIAFCSHTVLSDDPLEVRDTTMDARFRTNPLVTGSSGIRFYAGWPLVIRGGLRVGSLCVVDLVPRRLSAAQHLGLEQLARCCSVALEMRLASLQLTELTAARSAPVVSPRRRSGELLSATRGEAKVEIEHAMQQVSHALGCIAAALSEPSAPADLPPPRIRSGVQARMEAPAAPRLTILQVRAIELCLQSALSMLDIAHLVAAEDAGSTAAARTAFWGQLELDTKAAGRAAYAAALLLADRQAAAEQVTIGPIPADPKVRTNDSDSRRRALHGHWGRLKASGVGAAEFVDYLWPLAGREGISVKHLAAQPDSAARPWWADTDFGTLE